MKVGTLNRHITIERHPGRFPTIRGENPPQGIRYRVLEIRLWPTRLSVDIRWWRW